MVTNSSAHNFVSFFIDSSNFKTSKYYRFKWDKCLELKIDLIISLGGLILNCILSYKHK